MPEEIRTCLLNDSFPPIVDGVSNAVYNYADILQRSYGGSVVVTPYYPDVADQYPFPVIRYPSIDTTKLVGYRTGRPFNSAVLHRLESQRVDLLHCHCPMMSLLLARALREANDKPLILTYHTKFDIEISNAFNGKLLQNVALRLLMDNIQACDEVWAVSRGASENLRSLGFEGEIVIMENGVDMPKGKAGAASIAQLRAQHALAPGVPVLLFVGRVMWYKGFQTTLGALAALKAQGQPFQLVVIGDGAEKEEIIHHAHSLGLDGHCLFLDKILDRALLRTWYSAADLLLLPSSFDTFGLVVREAAACAVPSLLLKDSSAAEGVVDGCNGILAEEDNAQSMCAALLRYIHDLPRLRRMGENALLSLYVSWEDSIERAHARYEVVLERWKSGELHHKPARFDEFFSVFGEINEGLEKARSYANRMPKGGK